MPNMKAGSWIRQIQGTFLNMTEISEPLTQNRGQGFSYDADLKKTMDVCTYSNNTHSLLQLNDCSYLEVMVDIGLFFKD